MKGRLRRGCLGYVPLRPNPLGSSFVSKSSRRSYHEKFPCFVASWASTDHLVLSKWPSVYLVTGQSKCRPIDQERSIFSSITFGSEKNCSQVLPAGNELRVLDPLRKLDSALLENQVLLERITASIKSNHHCLFATNFCVGLSNLFNVPYSVL